MAAGSAARCPASRLSACCSYAEGGDRNGSAFKSMWACYQRGPRKGRFCGAQIQPMIALIDSAVSFFPRAREGKQNGTAQLDRGNRQGDAAAIRLRGRDVGHMDHRSRADSAAVKRVRAGPQWFPHVKYPEIISTRSGRDSGVAELGAAFGADARQYRCPSLRAR